MLRLIRQVDIHVAGELVDSFTEVETDTPEQKHEAQPTYDQDVPDIGT